MEAKMVHGALPLIVIDKNCNQVIAEISRLLTGSGFTVVESFDLQDARASHSGCTCPHHGTNQCTCQLAILLVYGEDAMPVSLMIHGNDERTELSINETPGQIITPAMKAKITSTLQPGYFIFADHDSMASVS
jgi:hypothetical protein